MMGRISWVLRSYRLSYIVARIDRFQGTVTQIDFMSILMQENNS